MMLRLVSAALLVACAWGQCPQLDIVFVVDQSQSMGPRGWAKTQIFMMDVIQNRTAAFVDYRYALVTFGYRGDISFGIGQNRFASQLSTAVISTDYKEGESNTTGGLEGALALITNNAVPLTVLNINRPIARDVVVLISDGKHTDEYPDPGPVADRLRQAGAIVLGINADSTNQDAVDEMNRITRNAQRVVNTNNYDGLDDVFDRFIQVLSGNFC